MCEFMVETKTPKKQIEILYLLTYLLTWLTGIIVYITEGQKNKRLKFHAIQAIFLGIAAFVVSFILEFTFIFSYIGTIISILAWVYGMYIGYMGSKGKDIEIPVIGEYARKYSK